MILVPILVFIVGAIGAIIAYSKYRSDRAAQRFTNAVHLYRRYLELAFQHPEFAEPRPSDHFDEMQYRKYEWFVGILLRACEELLEFKTSERWTNLVRSLLKDHLVYLRDDEWFKSQGLDLFSPELVKLVKEVLNDADREKTAALLDASKDC
jgi:hypothetical protein